MRPAKAAVQGESISNFQGRVMEGAMRLGPCLSRVRSDIDPERTLRLHLMHLASLISRTSWLVVVSLMTKPKCVIHDILKCFRLSPLSHGLRWPFLFQGNVGLIVSIVSRIRRAHEWLKLEQLWVDMKRASTSCRNRRHGFCCICSGENTTLIVSSLFTVS